MLAARLPARFRPARPTIFIIAAAFLGAALVLARMWNYGPGFGPDQVNYVETARNLLRGEGFTQLDGRPYVQWAPFYPALLAVMSLSIFDPRDVVGPLNAAVFGLIVFTAGRWLRSRLQSRFLAAWGVLAIACSLPLTYMASIAFPFAFLILFATLALMHLDDYLRDNRRKSFALACLFSALAWTSHYTGAALTVSIALALAFHLNTTPLSRIKTAVSYALFASAPTALWMLRNFLLTGYFTGDRAPIDYALLDLLSDSAAMMGEWVIVNLFVESRGVEPDLDRPLRTAGPLLAGSGLFAAALGAVLALRRSGPEGRGTERSRSFSIFAGFALAHLCITIAAAMLAYTHSGVQERYLFAAYLPLLIAGLFALDGFLSRRTEIPRAQSIVLTAGLTLWLALTVALQPLAIRDANAYGITRPDVGIYSAPRWVNSQTIAYIIENPPKGAVYSNHVEALTLYAPGLTIPRLRSFDPPAEWAAAAPGDAALAWFHAIGGKWNYDAADIRMTPGLEIVADLADGALFAVNKAHDPRPAYRAAYAALADREPIARSAYNLYLDGRTLAYAKSPCSREETSQRFFMHVIPANDADLPGDRKRYAFDNRDFSFERGGVRVDGACMISVALPPYPIAEIETGQFASGERLWEAKIGFPQ